MRFFNKRKTEPSANDSRQQHVQNNLRWGVRSSLADQVCNNNNPKSIFGARLSEPLQYFSRNTTFLEEAKRAQRDGRKITFYDSNSGIPLFVAPQGRSWDDFLEDAQKTGWLSFRKEEVVWENVKISKSGDIECISGAYLGIKQRLVTEGVEKYVVSLVAIAGRPRVPPPSTEFTALEAAQNFVETRVPCH